MSAIKSNVRSFRYSDRVAGILEEFGDGNLNASFEKLIFFCYDSIPARQKELERINKMIKEKQREHERLSEKLRDVSELIQTLQALQRYGELAAQKAKKISGGD